MKPIFDPKAGFYFERQICRVVRIFKGCQSGTGGNGGGSDGLTTSHGGKSAATTSQPQGGFTKNEN